jgi:ferrous iron transport protein A
VVAVAPMGGDPLLIQIGFTRFALRRAEAARVGVRNEVAA